MIWLTACVFSQENEKTLEVIKRKYLKPKMYSIKVGKHGPCKDGKIYWVERRMVGEMEPNFSTIPVLDGE